MAACADDADWRQVLWFYELIVGLVPGSMVTPNRAVVRGPAVALEQLDAAAQHPRDARSFIAG
jgi:predicted RNA polymerase sigma factor